MSLLYVARIIWHKNIWFETKITDKVFHHFETTILGISIIIIIIIIIIINVNNEKGIPIPQDWNIILKQTEHGFR